MRSVLLAGILVLAACATAPAAGIKDTSFTNAQGSRTIQFSGWIPAPTGEVFAAVATVEGWKTWAVPSAFGEAKVGPIMETSYDPAAKAGDPANIQQEFLELVPNRRAVFRTVRTPPGFPEAALYYKTIAAFDLAPDSGGTRLTFTHSGFGEGKGFDTLYDFFREGDASTIEELRKRFETGPKDLGKTE